MKEYKPKKRVRPKHILRRQSAWKGIEEILEDLLDTYNVKRNSAIEFGVEYGFSTVAISNYFNKVVGVDTFEGDIHSGTRTNHYKETSERLAPYKNIELTQSRYQEYEDPSQYDFAHVDIIHTYKDTYACGQLALSLAPVVIFHDTDSFKEVRQAVTDLAVDLDKDLHFLRGFNGLGIIH